MAVQYGTAQFFQKSTVRWYGTPFLLWYGTLVRYASKIELKYGTVQGARYVVRKFLTYRTVLPSLASSIWRHFHQAFLDCTFSGIYEVGLGEELEGTLVSPHSNPNLPFLFSVFLDDFGLFLLI